MAYEAIGPHRGQRSPGGPVAKRPAEAQQAGEAQQRSEHDEHEPGLGPQHVTGYALEVDHLGVRIGVRDEDRKARR